MQDALSVPAAKTTGSEPCRKVGQFVAKGGCFALQGDDGGDVWLEIDPIPLHLLDERVEISGRSYGADLVWVEAIGPIRGFS